MGSGHRHRDATPSGQRAPALTAIQEALARAGAELRRVDVLHLVTAGVKPHKLDAIEEPCRAPACKA
jgi:hypothetical protein